MEQHIPQNTLEQRVSKLEEKTNLPFCLSCPFIHDPMKMSLMVLYAVILHAIWGFSVLVEPVAANTTATSFLFQMIDHPILTGIIYLLSSFLASFSLFGKPKKWKLFCAFFQQGLLVQSTIGAIKCMVEGQFADGVARPPFFIIADQSAIVLATLLHSIALFRMATRIYSISFLKSVTKYSTDNTYDNS